MLNNDKMKATVTITIELDKIENPQLESVMDKIEDSTKRCVDRLTETASNYIVESSKTVIELNTDNWTIITGK